MLITTDFVFVDDHDFMFQHASLLIFLLQCCFFVGFVFVILFLTKVINVKSSLSRGSLSKCSFASDRLLTSSDNFPFYSYRLRTDKQWSERHDISWGKGASSTFINNRPVKLKISYKTKREYQQGGKAWVKVKTNTDQKRELWEKYCLQCGLEMNTIWHPDDIRIFYSVFTANVVAIFYQLYLVSVPLIALLLMESNASRSHPLLVFLI